MKKNPHENVSSVGLANLHQGLRAKGEGMDDNIVHVGDTVLAKCTSGPSSPAVDLKFLINDHSTVIYYNYPKR